MKIFKFLSIFLVVITVSLTSAVVFAQEKNAEQAQVSTKKKVTFKIPEGFMPAEIPPDKKGLMMLDPKKPAGMFVAYTPDNQKSEGFISQLRQTFAEFFVGEKNASLKWSEATLPAHDGVTNETGKLLTAQGKGNEVQVVAYTRTISAGQDVVYGYFAMKDTKSKKNSAEFVDATGKGVKEFEAFWKTVGVVDKQ